MAFSMGPTALTSTSRSQRSLLGLTPARTFSIAPFRSIAPEERAVNLRSRRINTRATSSGEDVDFDKVLSDIADKFEASDNKAAIVGYSAAAIGALWFSEWLIHLPLLNFLLGFPIQLLGLALLPYFGVKYLVEKDSIKSDAGDAFNSVVKRLPGLEK